MYQEQRLVFYYCVSPVHMGAGTATGAIDNPIQREVHTGHPLLAGSGIKGAVRHHCTSLWGDSAKNDITAIFGPDASASDHAGAVAFTDAQLVAFPVRSLKETFVYVTCPSALACLKRLAWKGKDAWAVPSVTQGSFLGDNADKLTVNGKLILEAFEFCRAGTDVSTISSWIADCALPTGNEHKFFRDKLRDHMIVLNDTDFSYFVQNSTVVEAHVRIDNVTGTAEKGGLFYTENLPPESLLVGQILATIERRKSKDSKSEPLMEAKAILDILMEGGGGTAGIDGKLVQMGGDATTGRGLLMLHMAGGGN